LCYARKIKKKIKKTSQKEIPEEQKAAGQVCLWDSEENGLEAEEEKKEVIWYPCDMPDSYTDAPDSSTLDTYRPHRWLSGS